MDTVKVSWWDGKCFDTFYPQVVDVQGTTPPLSTPWKRSSRMWHLCAGKVPGPSRHSKCEKRKITTKVTKLRDTRIPTPRKITGIRSHQTLQGIPLLRTLLIGNKSTLNTATNALKSQLLRCYTSLVPQKLVSVCTSFQYMTGRLLLHLVSECP